MKKFLLLMCAFLLTAMGMNAKSYKIAGKLKGDTEGKTVYLCKTGTSMASLYRPLVLDSTVIRNGMFVFKGKLNGPTMMMLKYFPNDNRGEMEPDGRRYAVRQVLPLFIDGGKISIEAHVDSMGNDFEYSLYGVYDYKDARIVGSELNDLYR